MGFSNLIKSIYGKISDNVYRVPRIDSSTNALETITYEHHEIHNNSHYYVEDHTTLASAETLDFCFETASGTAVPHMLFNFEATGLITLDIYEGVTASADGTIIAQKANNRDNVFIGSHTPAGTSSTIMTDSVASFVVDELIGWTIFNITDGSYGVITDNDSTTVTVASLIGGTDNDWDQNDVYEINKSLSVLRADCTVTDVGYRLGGSSGGDANNPNKGIPGGFRRDNELVLRRGTKYLFRFTSGANDNILSYIGYWYEHAEKN